MRVVYTGTGERCVYIHVGYTFQMRVVYTSLHVVKTHYAVGYTFQMRVVYTYLLESNFLTYI